jgi:chemotaxis protein methyltransferase CheR
MERDPDVDAIEVRLLLQAIHDKYGYDLRGYSEPTMQRRAMAVLARSGLPHLGELLHQVLVDPELFARVLNDMTVRVTDMFRDPDLYRVFRARIVPVLRSYPLLRIWHAGCASGEEAYASAILLLEEGLLDRAQIYATDLSPRAIEDAKHGVYGAERVAAFAENHQRAGGQRDFSDYYTAAYGGIAMSDVLRRSILFFQHNLVSDHAFGEMHVFFCRNVFIYFGADLRARVLAKLAESLCPGGFLCLGSSEQVPRSELPTPFSEYAPQERIYRHAPR